MRTSYCPWCIVFLYFPWFHSEVNTNGDMIITHSHSRHQYMLSEEQDNSKEHHSFQKLCTTDKTPLI